MEGEVLAIPGAVGAVEGEEGIGEEEVEGGGYEGGDEDGLRLFVSGARWSE